MTTLSEWRERRYLSVGQLARYAGVDRGTIYSIESGRTTSPQRSTVKAICDTLRVSVEEVDEFRSLLEPRVKPVAPPAPPAYDLPLERDTPVPERIQSLSDWLYELGRSQTDLIRMTGLSHMTVQRAVNRSVRPSPKTARLICDALDLTRNHVIEFVFSLRFHPCGGVAGRMSGSRYLIFTDVLNRLPITDLYRIVRLHHEDIDQVLMRTNTPVTTNGFIFADTLRAFFPNVELVRSESLSEARHSGRDTARNARQIYAASREQDAQRSKIAALFPDAKAFDTSGYEDDPGW